MARTADRTSATARSSAGLTAVEVVVVLALALMLTLGLYAITAGQRRTYSGQVTGLTAQQNARGALEYLQRQLRMAGYGFGGCSGAVKRWAGEGERTVDAPLVSFRALNDCSLYHHRGGDGETCHGHGVDSLVIGFSTATMTGTLTGVRLLEPMATSAAALRVSACGALRDGDVLALWEPGSPKPCTLLQATKDPAACSPADVPPCERRKRSCTIQHRPQPPFNPPPDLNAFPAGGYPAGSLVMNLGRLQPAITLAIDRSQPVPRLLQWRRGFAVDGEVIAEGIEDLQLSWACDMNQNGTLDEGGDPESRRGDEWAHNVPGDSPPSCRLPPGCAGATCRELPVKVVRVTLIARSSTVDDAHGSGFRPASEDRPAGSPADDGTLRNHEGAVILGPRAGTYHRAVLSAVVPLWNAR